MVTKSIIYKKSYKNINSEGNVPNLTIEQIGQILIDAGMIYPFIKYESTTFPINFRDILKGTRKDITFHYNDKTPILGKSIEKDGTSVGNIIGYEKSERIIKVNCISFFTVIKENSTEHRIFQIGRRYIGEDENFK